MMHDHRHVLLVHSDFMNAISCSVMAMALSARDLNSVDHMTWPCIAALWARRTDQSATRR